MGNLEIVLSIINYSSETPERCF